MWRLLKRTRSTVIPKSDFLFDKVKDLEKLAPYLMPKLEGKWKIICVGLTLKELIYIQEKVIIPEDVEILFYVSQDIIARFTDRFPKVLGKDKTNKELYQELIKNLPKLISDSAAYSLYNKFQGNLKRIEESIVELIDASADSPMIEPKHVDAVSLVNNNVYAKDVLYTYLLHSDITIPKKGHIYSRYRWKNPEDMYTKLIDSIGTRFAFYAIRKQLSNLVDNKIAYMNNKECDIITSNVDVMWLSELYSSFLLYSWESLPILMENILRRERDDSLFKTKSVILAT